MIHVVLILVFTILGFLVDNVASGQLYVNLNAAWVCFGGFLDIVVSYLMFFIFDEHRESITRLVEDYRLRIDYQVLDVIKTENTEFQDSRNDQNKTGQPSTSFLSSSV